MRAKCSSQFNILVSQFHISTHEAKYVTMEFEFYVRAKRYFSWRLWNTFLTREKFNSYFFAED